MKLVSLEKSQKVALGCSGVFVFGLLFGWVMFPAILKFMLKREMSLAKGRDLRDMWTIIPFPLDFKVYLFNYTNAEEVMRGAKPILKEIGPFFYYEWKEKKNMEDIEEEDAIYFNRKDTFIFDKTKSNGLTGDELVIMPNIIFVSTIGKIIREKPEFMKLAVKAMDGIFNEPKSIFTTYRAADLLFDGVLIKCDKTDFAPKAVCTALRKEKTLQPVGDTDVKFSMFGMKNGTVEEVKYKVLRGIKNIMDVGKVIEFNGTTEMHIWNGEKCNALEGTDGTVFPPFLTIKDKLETFSPELCRSVKAWYVRPSSYAGIKTNRYVSDLGDLPNEPDNHCFCETPETCPKKGLMDLYRCAGVPIVASHPHYLDVDDSLKDTVIGFQPNEEDHGIYVDFEPISGTPLKGKKRLQLNIVVPHVETYGPFKNFSNTILPLLWIEEGIEMNKTFIDMLNNQLFIALRIVQVVRWSMVIFGFVVTAATLIARQTDFLAKFTVSPEHVDDYQKNHQSTTLGAGTSTVNTISAAYAR